MLAACRSPYITRYYGCILEPGSSELCICMELMAGSLADMVRAATLQCNDAPHTMHRWSMPHFQSRTLCTYYTRPCVP